MKRAKGVQGIGYMIMFMLLSILFLISPVLAGGTTIFVNDVSANHGETIQMPINISGAKDIGSMDISLQYDPNVLSLKSVEKGNLTQDSIVEWNAKADKVLIGIVGGSGTNGNGSLAILFFDVLGYPGSISDLDLEASAFNVMFSPIPLKISDGVFTVSGSTEPTATSTPTPSQPSSGESSTRSTSSGGGITTPTKNEGLTIRIENVYADANSTIKIPIYVENASDIGSADFYLHFNSSVLNLTDITKGELTTKSLLQWNIVNQSRIRFVIIDASGINGNGPIAYLNFSVIGASGSMTELNFSKLEITDAISTEEISAAINNGSLFIKSAVSNEPLMSESNKTIHDRNIEVPAQETPIKIPQSTQEREPAKSQPGFESTTSALAIALLAFLFVLKRNRRVKK